MLLKLFKRIEKGVIVEHSFRNFLVQIRKLMNECERVTEKKCIVTDTIFSITEACSLFDPQKIQLKLKVELNQLQEKVKFCNCVLIFLGPKIFRWQK